MSNSPVLWALQLCTIPCGALFTTCNPLGPFPSECESRVYSLRQRLQRPAPSNWSQWTESRLSSSYDFAFFLHKLWKIGVCLWKSKSFSKYFHCQDLKRVYNVKLLWYDLLMFVFCCPYPVNMASFVYSTSCKLSECILCSSYPTAGMSCFPNDRYIFFALLHKYLRSVAKSTCRRQMRSKDINKYKHLQNWPELHRQWLAPYLLFLSWWWHAVTCFSAYFWTQIPASMSTQWRS